MPYDIYLRLIKDAELLLQATHQDRPEQDWIEEVKRI